MYNSDKFGSDSQIFSSEVITQKRFAFAIRQLERSASMWSGQKLFSSISLKKSVIHQQCQ